MNEKPVDSDQSESSPISNEAKLPKVAGMQAETRLAHTVVDRTSRNVAEGNTSEGELC